jgi:hypothetical protein
MNERIKELAGQADNYAYKMNPEEDSYGRPANPRKFQQDRDAKFAELIVRECAKVLWDSNDILGEYRIKKHFGVEE